MNASDAASSDVVGSILIVAVIVTAIGIGMAAYQNRALDDTPTPPSFETIAIAEPGSKEVIVTHAGGDAVDKGRVRVTVVVDGVVAYEGPLGADGDMWSVGESLRIGPLPFPLQDGQKVEVFFTGATQGGTTASFGRADGTAGTPTSTTVTPAATLRISFEGGSARVSLEPTQPILLEAAVDHSDGRKLIRSVEARVAGWSSRGTPMYDDGTHGDRIAGDGIYSAFLQVPVGATPGDYEVVVTVIDLNGQTATGTAIVTVKAVAPTGAGPVIPGPSTPPPEEPPTATPPPETVPPPIGPVPPDAFTITPGGVIPACDGPVVNRIIGTEITYGINGPSIPVRTWFTTTGGATWTAMFGGRPVVAGDEFTWPNASAGTRLGLRASADYATFHAMYDSVTSNPHVLVLRDGDAAPRIDPYGNQQGVEVWLRPYVRDGHVTIASNQVIFLFEFTRDLTSSAADFQDLVVLMTFPQDECTMSRVYTPMSEPTGAYQKINIVGKEKQSTSTGPQSGQVLFVPLEGACRIDVVVGTGGVTDSVCVEDGLARLALQRGAYDIFIRMAGTPDGDARLGGCFEQGGSSWCGISRLDLSREGDGSVQDATGAFLTHCVEIDGTLVRRPLLADDERGVFWEYSGAGLRVMHMRLYAAADTTPAPPC